MKSKIQGWLTNRVSAEDLLTRYQRTGDNRYLSVLVEQFNRPLFHYLITMTDAQLAEDVLQSTWLTVINQRQTVGHFSHVKNWLFTIARHRLIDELRRRKRWHSDTFDEQTHGNSSITDLENLVSDHQQLDLFNRVLALMPAVQREAFIFQQEGFSIHDIAQLTESELETVKSRLRYARQHLKKYLGSLA